jgi:glycosyltransferase involved in cell wall biosynthesis
MPEPALRIAISAPLLAPHDQGSYRSAGIHTYIEQTLQRLPEADPALAVTLFAAHPPASLPSSIEVLSPRWKIDGPVQRIAWEQTVLPLAVRRARAALLHATAFVAPVVRAVPTVITIYDLSFALFPQYFRGFNQAYLRLGTRISARRARRIVTISECARRDIHRLYGVPLDRIAVAYPGVAETLKPSPPDRVQQFRYAKRLPEKFLLYLGTLEPRKNLGLLVRAFTELKRACPDAVLVLAGGVGWLINELETAIESSGVKDSILRPGFVPAEEKALWYASATAFVYPSLYEGFGLPPLEALACGTPVIASDAASLPEVVGEAGLLLAPDDARGWAKALTYLWNDAAARAALADRGVRRAQQFRWLNTARGQTQTYRQAIIST